MIGIVNKSKLKILYEKDESLHKSQGFGGITLMEKKNDSFSHFFNLIEMLNFLIFDFIFL